jgi:CRP-like cAMP-binding protein
MQRTPRQNRLLAALPGKVFERLAPHLQLIPLPRGWAIYDPGSTLQFAVFPTSSIVSVLSLLEDGSSPEVAIIGNDGVVGIAVFMGGAATTNTRAVVQSAGHGYRIPVGILRSVMESEPALRDLMMRYVMSLGTQMAQYAVCNRFHLVEQQVCRLLLMCLDRWASNRLSLTHERKANLLGVRREAVSTASSNLASAGVISYRRGCVTILDRAGLEARSCECYELVKTETHRLLPLVAAPPSAGLMPAI